MPSLNGSVYLAKGKEGNKYAIKCYERTSNKFVNLNKTYIDLYNKKNEILHIIPKVHYYMKTELHYLLCTELMDSSLKILFNNYGNKFDLSTVTLLGLDIVTLLESL